MSFRFAIILFLVIALAGAALFSFILAHESAAHLDCPITKASGSCAVPGPFGMTVSAIYAFISFLSVLVPAFAVFLLARSVPARSVSRKTLSRDIRRVVSERRDKTVPFVFCVITRWLSLHEVSPSRAYAG